MIDLPDPPKRIQPEALLVECMTCGGFKHRFAVEVIRSPLLVEPIKGLRDLGPCKVCDGKGTHRPRMLDL